MKYLKIVKDLFDQKPLWFRYFCFFMVGVVAGAVSG